MATLVEHRLKCIRFMATAPPNSTKMHTAASSRQIDRSLWQHFSARAIDYTNPMSKRKQDATDSQTPGEIRLEDGFELRTHAPEQETLFPKEELVIPPAIQGFRKSVAIMHGFPIGSDAKESLNRLRVMDGLIIIAQIDFRQRGKAELERVVKDRLSPFFDFRIGELARIAGIPGKNYQRIWDELNGIYEQSYLWNAYGKDGSVEFEMKSRFLSALGPGVGRKTGMVRIAMDPSALAMVLDPGEWAAISIAAQSDKNLRSEPAYRLYQNTWRYVNTHHKVTAAMPTEAWIDLIAGKDNRFVTMVDGQRRATGYADFKRRVLLPAMARVNAVRALSYTLELKEHKSGNRVAKLQFNLIPKKQESLGLPLVWSEDTLDFITGCGFTEAEINDLSEANSYEEILETVARMRASMIRMKELKKKITSKKAYFRGTLANVVAGAREDDAEKIEKESAKQQAEIEAEERRERVKELWEGHRKKRFREGLADLPSDQKSSLLDEFLKSEEGERARILLKKGADPFDSAAAMAFVRLWMERAHSDLVEQILSRPEDRSLEAWLAWRVTQQN